RGRLRDLEGRPLLRVELLGLLEGELGGELRAGGVLDRAALLPRIDRLLLGGLRLGRAALATLRLGGLVVRADVVVLVARVLAVLRAPRIERGDHVVDVTRLAVDAGDRPLRAILLAAVGLDLHVLVVERDGALEVAAD